MSKSLNTNLNIRAFAKKMKREAYERQDGVCVKCKEKFDIEDMELTTSPHGTRVVKPLQKIAKCCVKIVTEESLENK